MKKYYIYLFHSSDDKGTYTEKHYYRTPIEKNNLQFIGTCEVDDQYFCATSCKYYDDQEMYTRKEVNKAYLSAEQGSVEKGILGDYFRLRFNYIPQLLSKFKPDKGGYFTPHRSAPCQHQNS
jgi:hypothetical protein